MSTVEEQEMLILQPFFVNRVWSACNCGNQNNRKVEKLFKHKAREIHHVASLLGTPSMFSSVVVSVILRRSAFKVDRSCVIEASKILMIVLNTKICLCNQSTVRCERLGWSKSQTGLERPSAGSSGNDTGIEQ